MPYSSKVVDKRRGYSMTELTMQSRIMTDDEVKNGKKSEWYRLNLCGYVKNFPRSICKLTYITTLVLKNNQLEYLPDEVANLVNLVNLDVSGNKLHSLPPSMGCMYELRALLLSDNKISEIPCEFGQLHNLRVMKLHGNPLIPQLASLYGDGGDYSVRNVINYLLETYYNLCKWPSD